jgi:predicted NUDIX family phosphoesterase
MARKEQVLVIWRKALDELGMFQGLNFEVERYLDALFEAGRPQFINRTQAERDPAYKQLIPYVIMMHANKYLTYVRGKRAGEARLVGNRSIGIGGHVNPGDCRNSSPNENLRKAYLAAVEREVAEEVYVEAAHSDHVVALLNDDSNEVGRVHLGIVHLWVLDSPAVSRREQMITQMEFLGIDELLALRETMETWSQLCVDGLEKMAVKVG